jgi:hypothetical protein
VVGVRTRGAAASDVRALTAALGPPAAALAREPDLEVQFTPSLATAGLSWIEPGRTGFAEDGFYLLREGAQPTRARFSFGASTAAGGWALACERGGRRIPLLLPLVRLAALRRRALPLHASAFEVDGCGVIASGWARGGKTTALLAFMERGARFLADDWILLAEDGARMVGLPGDVTVSPEQASSPLLQARVGGGARLARHALRQTGDALGRAAAAAGDGTLARTTGKVGAALARRSQVTLPPEALFGNRRVQSATPRALFLMVRHDAPHVTVEPLDVPAAAARLASASGYEELPLLSLALGYRFAFPEREAPAFFEEAAALRERLLARAVGALRSYVVRHPKRIDPAELHRAMASCLEAAP